MDRWAFLIFTTLVLSVARLAAGQTLKTHPGPAGKVVDSCWDCHKNGRAGRDYRASIHFVFGAGCIGCHGGDPTKVRREDAESKDAGFRGRISVFDIPEVCAKCHGKPDAVKWSRGRRNAFEEYKQGVHAEALWQKDERGAPQCATCHGAHRVLRVDDPGSPAHPANVNRTCAKCHADEEYKENFGLNIEVPGQVARGVHGLKGAWSPGLNLPTCASCHGAHWNFRPQWENAEVFEICGTCHTAERAAFGKNNPHFAAEEKVHCAKCHTAHEVKPATPAMSRDPKVCAACHNRRKNPKDPALDYIGRVLKAVAPVRRSIHRSRRVLADLRSAGFKPVEETRRVDRVERAFLTGFGLVQHQLVLVKNFKALEAAAERAQAAEAAILAVKGRHRWTRIALWGGAIYAALLAGVFWLRRRKR
jgi:hypothetical protein